MKKKTSAAGRITLAIIMAIVILLALALWKGGWLGYQPAEAQRAGALAATHMTFNGQPVDPAGTLTLYEADGLRRSATERLQSQNPDFETTSLANSFALATQPVSAAATVTAPDGAVVWQGGFENLPAFVPPYDGEYAFEIAAEFEQEDFSASFLYTFTICFRAPANFYFLSDTVAQGGVLVLIGENLRTQDVHVEIPYSFVPHPAYSGTGCTVLLPFNYIRAAGDYSAAVSYAGQRWDLPYTVTETEFEVQWLTVSSSITGSTIDNSAAVEEYANAIPPLREYFDPNIYWEGDFIQPVEGWISTEFGIRRYINDNPDPVRHAGIDIACDEGTPVAASNSGQILFSGYLQQSGNTVLIDHGMGLQSLYLHMSALYYETGDFVHKGDFIGAVGETGFATGPHLHFEMTIGGHCINPWRAFDGTAAYYQLPCLPNGL